MKRQGWHFEFTAGEVAVAAEARVTHHRERLEYYQALFDVADKQIKTLGVKVDTIHHSGGHELSVSVDKAIEKEWNLYRNKLERHKTKTEEYEGWVHVLGTQPDILLPLDHEDILYFNLSGD